MTTTRPPLSHRQWMDLAAEEYRRILALLDELREDEWLAPTECEGWRVRDVVAHLAGAAAATASVREQLRQQRHGRREKRDRLQIDAVNDLQVSERSTASVAALREELAMVAKRSVAARDRTPGWVRGLRFGFPPPVGRASLGFLNDVVYTRDAWMHRADICRATGRVPQLTADHDRLIVADAAHAWLEATGAPGIRLSGPAGTDLGDGGPESDALEFARALSGRGSLPGVAADVVLF